MNNEEILKKILKDITVIIRPVELTDGKDQWSSDMEVLWEKYCEQPYLFFAKGLDKKIFLKNLLSVARQFKLLIGEIATKNDASIKSVAFGMAKNDGWRTESHVDYFKGVTNKEILAVMVTYLMEEKCSSDIGYSVHYSHEDTKNLHDKCCMYGLLESKGKIKREGSRKEEYVYIVRGNKPETKNTPRMEDMIF